jgi:hypothetical protein
MPANARNDLDRRAAIRRSVLAGALACAAVSALASGPLAGDDSLAPSIADRARSAIMSGEAVLHLRAVVTARERGAQKLYDTSDHELWLSLGSDYQRGIERNRRGTTFREVVERPDADRQAYVGGGGPDPHVEIHPPLDAGAPAVAKAARSSASPWLEDFVDTIEQRLDEGAAVAGETEIHGQSAYRLEIDRRGVSADVPATLREVRAIPVGSSAWDSFTLWVHRDTYLPIAARGRSELPGKGPREFRVRFIVAERVQFSKSLFELTPRRGLPVCNSGRCSSPASPGY